MVISIASHKGGTGKTSTTTSLSAGLAHRGQKVLLVYIDSQANSSKVLLHDYQKISKEQTIYTTIIDRKPLPVRLTHVKNLSIVPSHILLSNTDIELTTAKDHREARLKSELDKIKNQFDFIFIDNPPALGWLTLNSFTASDNVLVVVSPGYFELDSLVQLSKTLDEVREYFNADLTLLGYLFTMSEPTLNTSASLQILRQTYTEKVLKTVIPRNTDLRDAHFQKQDIFSFNPRAKAALAYDKLIREVFLTESASDSANAYEETANVDQIQSELRGESAFFPGYKGSRSTSPPPQEPEPVMAPVQPDSQIAAGTPQRPNARTPERETAKRIITRNSFEIYEDQMDSRRRLSYQDKMEGKLGSMSAMVREAIDAYLKEHPFKK